MDRSGVAKLVHDLRTPLNSIAITAELAKVRAAKGEDVSDNLDAIVRICRECGAQLETYRRENAEKNSGSPGEEAN